MNPADFNVPNDYTTARHADDTEDRIGPFFRSVSANSVVTAFRATAAHCNAMSVLHGGVLMTFADYTLSEVALHGGEQGEHCLTISFDAQFIAGGKDGELLHGEAEVTRRTRSLTFVRGLIYTQRDGARVSLLAFSGIGKRVRAAG